MTTRALRIGSGAGYAGDRIDPAQALAERGALDWLAFECLAERTVALAQLRKQQQPQHGFDPLLQARLRAVLQVARELGAAAAARGRGAGRRRVALDAGQRPTLCWTARTACAAWTAA